MPDVQLTKTKQTDADRVAQDALKVRGVIPTHIACIMDGNGRWAQAQGQPRVVGHKHGVTSVRDITEACAQLGVKHLTLYTFSTENWHRPADEVSALMTLLVRTLRGEIKRLDENGIRLRAFGDLSRLPGKGRREMEEGMERTAANTRMSLNLALSYSGRWELVEAARALAREAAAGHLDPEAITEASIEGHLATVGLPDPDLLIRTGGDLRVSNFLLWQIAYTEIVVTERFWPAFRREALYEAIRAFQDRERRFGRVPAHAPV
ncbi:MAG: isoprenyl transferase [Bacteroidota bacterium]